MWLVLWCTNNIGVTLLNKAVFHGLSGKKFEYPYMVRECFSRFFFLEFNFGFLTFLWRIENKIDRSCICWSPIHSFALSTPLFFVLVLTMKRKQLSALHMLIGWIGTSVVFAVQGRKRRPISNRAYRSKILLFSAVFRYITTLPQCICSVYYDAHGLVHPTHPFIKCSLNISFGNVSLR